MTHEDAIGSLPGYTCSSWSIHSLGALAQAFEVPRAVRRSPSLCQMRLVQALSRLTG